MTARPGPTRVLFGEDTEELRTTLHTRIHYDRRYCNQEIHLARVGEPSKEEAISSLGPGRATQQALSSPMPEEEARHLRVVIRNPELKSGQVS
jgi:hypothetical protein